MVFSGRKGAPAQCVEHLVLVASVGVAAACGGSSVAADSGSGPDSFPRDPRTLALERCGTLPEPDHEVRLIEARGSLRGMTPCGHLITWDDESFRVYSPDFSTVVVEGYLPPPVVSPDGTRVAFRAVDSEGRAVIRRVDLLSLATWDTVVTTHVDEFGDEPNDFGLYLGLDDRVESWICDDGLLHLFADQADENPPLAEFENFSCYYQRDPDGRFLVYPQTRQASAVDLVARRQYDVPFGHYADEVERVLGGQAVAAVWYTEERGGDVVYRYPHAEPLIETRTGRKIADRWELVPTGLGVPWDLVPTGLGFHAANRLGDPPALVTSSASGLVVSEGLRGIYVFSDLRRAIAVARNEAGEHDVIFADLASGERTPIAAGVPHGWDPDEAITENGLDPFVATVKASSLESAAYVALSPCGGADCFDEIEWVRWVDGRAERLSGIMGLPGPAVVADDGSAFFGTALRNDLPGFVVDAAGSVVPYSFEPRYLWYPQFDGRVVAFEEPVEPDMAARFLTFDIVSLEVRELAVATKYGIGSATDPLHRRLAFDIEGTGEVEPGELPNEVWAGRFPPGR